MEERTTYVGLDVHKKMINVALLRPGTREPLTWEVPQEPEAVRRFKRKLHHHEPFPVRGHVERALSVGAPAARL